MGKDGYRTVAAAGRDEFTEKRSRFIGYACPVKTEAEALDWIRARSKEHWDAKHNVYAYILENGQLCRYSDDGEPQGTAGIPVLEVLRKNGLTDCAVVVTRYFGGILLGGGGLVRAYSHGAALAVEAAGIVEMRRCLCFRLRCSYNQYGFLPALLAAHGAKITDTLFEDAVTVEYQLEAAGQAALEAALTERSAGSLTPERTGEVFAPFEAKTAVFDEK